MAIPDLAVELRIDGKWKNITDDVRATDDIEITRGRPDETDTSDPGECTFTINNRKGKYSPRNPMSEYYGKLGMNTPVRVRLGDAKAQLNLPGSTNSFALLPYSDSDSSDDASADVEDVESSPDESESEEPSESEDIGETDSESGSEIDFDGESFDLRIEVEPDSWRPGTGKSLASQMRVSEDEGTDRSWYLMLTEDGKLQFSWYKDNDSDDRKSAISSEAVGKHEERLALAVIVEADDDEDETRIKFYTADRIDDFSDHDRDDWDKLGNTQVYDESIPIRSSEAGVTVGSSKENGQLFGDVDNFNGAVYRFQLRDKVEGDKVTDVDFTDADPADQYIQDGENGRWELKGSASVSRPDIRFTGEVTEWPVRWDKSGNDSTIELKATGILRRLQQGEKALKSAMRRGMLKEDEDAPVAYWPMEDGEDAHTLSSPISDFSMSFNEDVTPSDYDEFASSEAIPTFDGGVARGTVEDYQASDKLRVLGLFHFPEDPVEDETALIDMSMIGSRVVRWILSMSKIGSLKVRAWNNDPQPEKVVETNWLAFDVNETRSIVGFLLKENGNDIDIEVFTSEIGDETLSVIGKSLEDYGTIGAVKDINLGTSIPGEDNDDDGLDGVAIGHIMALPYGYIWDVHKYMNAWRGETASERIERLSDEEGVPMTVLGGKSDSEKMGPQGQDQFMDLLEDAAETDDGLLTETRDRLGLQYRPRSSMYSQGPVLSLDFSEGEVTEFEPTDDDQSLRNDITVERDKGSSARAQKKDGPLSVNDPPDGVGRYDEEKTLNVEKDSQLEQLAQWHVHLGTVDEIRFENLEVNLSAPRMEKFHQQALRMDVGDLIRIDNPPENGPPDRIEQIIQGYTETINYYEWKFEFNCSPASPWAVGRAEDTEQLEDIGPDSPNRADTIGSELDEDIDKDTEEFDVITTAGPAWIDSYEYEDHFPFDVRIGGEIMRVEEVDDDSESESDFTGDAQRFKVKRSKNNIKKKHDKGTSVELAYPTVVAL